MLPPLVFFLLNHSADMVMEGLSLPEMNHYPKTLGLLPITAVKSVKNITYSVLMAVATAYKLPSLTPNFATFVEKKYAYGR